MKLPIRITFGPGLAARERAAFERGLSLAEHIVVEGGPADEHRQVLRFRKDATHFTSKTGHRYRRSGKLTVVRVVLPLFVREDSDERTQG